jgi:hypothetical protein
LAEIIELHEEILGELHRVVPISEYTQTEASISLSQMPAHPAHRRWRSLDAVPKHDKSGPLLQASPGMDTEPQIAAEVARIFTRRVCNSPIVPLGSRLCVYGPRIILLISSGESLLHI